MNKQELKQLNEELDYILEDLQTIHQKYYDDIKRKDFNKILTMDPTYNQRNNKLGSYGKWLLSMYKKDNDILDKHEKVFDTLQFYDKNKRHFKSNDIFKYSLDELFDEYEDLKDLDLLSDRQQRKQISKININQSDDIDKIYEDDEWALYVPKTYKASIKLGRNTYWCTSVSENDEYFKEYSFQGPLVVCINKDTGEKYQYHKESNQFKNTKDYEADRNILSQDVWNYLNSQNFENYKEEYFKYINHGFPHGSFAAWFGEDLTGQIYYDNIDCSYNNLTSLKGAPQKVVGYFDCSGNKLTSLQGAPQRVGYFDCSYNNLTSLQGAPQKVGGNFECSRNQLTSLEGAPQEVERDFNCSYNQLTSLYGTQQEVRGNFYCSDNQLTSLHGAPQKVGGDFYCSDNQLTSLQGAPQEIGGSFDCFKNKLTSLQGAPQEVGENFSCRYNKLTSLQGAPQEVGGYFDCRHNPNLKSLDGIGNVKDKIYSDID